MFRLSALGVALADFIREFYAFVVPDGTVGFVARFPEEVLFTSFPMKEGNLQKGYIFSFQEMERKFQSLILTVLNFGTVLM